MWVVWFYLCLHIWKYKVTTVLIIWELSLSSLFTFMLKSVKINQPSLFFIILFLFCVTKAKKYTLSPGMSLPAQTIELLSHHSHMFRIRYCMDKLAKHIQDGNVTSYLLATHLASLSLLGPSALALHTPFTSLHFLLQFCRASGCEETGISLEMKNSTLNRYIPASWLPAGRIPAASPSPAKRGEEESLVSHPPSYSHVLGCSPSYCCFLCGLLMCQSSKGAENVTSPGLRTTWQLLSLIFFSAKLE